MKSDRRTALDPAAENVRTADVVRHASATRIPAVEPADAFRRLAGRRGVFWLDSSLPRERDGRFSIMGCEPRWVFTARGAAWTLAHATDAGEVVERGASDALHRLDDLLDADRVLPADVAPELPFFGGAVGWLSYDLGRQFEELGGTATDDLDAPDIYLAWYDAAIVWDHQANVVWRVAVTDDRPARAIPTFQDLAADNRQSSPAPAKDQAPRDRTTTEARSDLSRAEYMARVAAIRDGIARGEYYQLNLVQRFSCPHREPPAQTYLRLRALNPAPFAAYFATSDTVVLSSSPERFLEISPAGEVRTCPIKGTRPRGATHAEDAARQRELLTCEKERAELLMIVDLLRNDLGRVCVPGSVQVTRLHALESFATVHHLVGEVRAQLRRGLSRAELLRAVFPGGSITGAPKVSAMRAIDRLEPHRRGIGMGSLGYFSAHGRVDLNIAIRTIVSRGGTAYVPVGAGIVWDSDPAAEYEETLAKARALFAALGAREVVA